MLSMARDATRRDAALAPSGRRRLLLPVPFPVWQAVVQALVLQFACDPPRATLCDDQVRLYVTVRSRCLARCVAR
jgi:hypothetical protein